jgi:hypothetical protein
MSSSEQQQFGNATTPATIQSAEMLERVAAHADSVAVRTPTIHRLPAAEPSLPFGFSAIPVATRRTASPSRG